VVLEDSAEEAPAMAHAPTATPEMISAFSGATMSCGISSDRRRFPGSFRPGRSSDAADYSGMTLEVLVPQLPR
jgi:hypothetical protein